MWSHPLTCGRKWLIHSKMSTVSPLKLGNGWWISSQSILGMWLLINEIKVNPSYASFTPNSFAIRPNTFQHKLQNWLKRTVLIKCFVLCGTITFLSSFQYVDHVFIQSTVRWYPVQIGSSHQFTSWGRRFQTVQVRVQCVGTRSDPVVLRSHYVQFRPN